MVFQAKRLYKSLVDIQKSESTAVTCRAVIKFNIVYFVRGSGIVVRETDDLN